jgi:tRNA uridine 5-carbamoylmethylation protein Kti12
MIAHIMVGHRREESGMKTTTYAVSLVVTASLMTFSPHARADSCSDAESAAQKYIDSYDTIRTMEVDQLKRLVKAVCESDDSERKQVTEDEKNRVESMVASAKSDLDKARADTTSKLSAAISDPECEGDKSKLESLQGDVDKYAERIQKIADNGAKMGSNPAFDKLREMGQLAHDDYYDHHSECEPYRDIEVGDLKPDCILPDGCVVIELKPDNSSAASRGYSNAKESRDRLNTDEGFDALDSKYKEAFASCKQKFKARVDCYHYCPEVDDGGQFKSTSFDWTTCKSD